MSDMVPPADAGIAYAQITGLVLAGGRSRRWGGVDKAWQRFAGRPMVHRVCERLAAQTGAVWISANRDLERYGALGHRVLIDDWPDGRGPLAGIATALRRIETPWLLVVPVDSPALPTISQRYSARRRAARNGCWQALRTASVCSPRFS